LARPKLPMVKALHRNSPARQTCSVARFLPALRPCPPALTARHSPATPLGGGPAWRDDVPLPQGFSFRPPTRQGRRAPEAAAAVRTRGRRTSHYRMGWGVWACRLGGRWGTVGDNFASPSEFELRPLFPPFSPLVLLLESRPAAPLRCALLPRKNATRRAESLRTLNRPCWRLLYRQVFADLPRLPIPPDRASPRQGTHLLPRLPSAAHPG